VKPPLTVCVLTYGPYAALARRAIDSIRRHFDRSSYRLVVGANAPGEETWRYLVGLSGEGAIDRLHLSAENLNKCPMMRRMFADIDTDYIWWFDDDSYVKDATALPAWLGKAQASPADVAAWGHVWFFGNVNDFNYGTDVVGFIRRASWYRGQEPPSWEPGGRGDWNFEGKGTGDGRWFFATGGCWMIRTSAVRALDWPDPGLVKRNDDVFLAEAIRQRGWRTMDVGSPGVAINTEPRRGVGEDPATMERQMESNLR